MMAAVWGLFCVVCLNTIPQFFVWFFRSKFRALLWWSAIKPWSITNAVVVYFPSGSQKLNKSSSNEDDNTLTDGVRDKTKIASSDFKLVFISSSDSSKESELNSSMEDANNTSVSKSKASPPTGRSTFVKNLRLTFLFGTLSWAKLGTRFNQRFPLSCAKMRRELEAKSDKKPLDITIKYWWLL